MIQLQRGDRKAGRRGRGVGGGSIGIVGDDLPKFLMDGGGVDIAAESCGGD
jgi:hypothetical protein